MVILNSRTPPECPQRDKACAKIIEFAPEDGSEKTETVPVKAGNVKNFRYKFPQTTPRALYHVQVRYICDGDFGEYKPDNGVCGYWPDRDVTADDAGYNSFRTRPIEVRNLARVRGPLVALMFVAPLFLAGYFLKDFVFR